MKNFHIVILSLLIVFSYRQVPFVFILFLLFVLWMEFRCIFVLIPITCCSRQTSFAWLARTGCSHLSRPPLLPAHSLSVVIVREWSCNGKKKIIGIRWVVSDLLEIRSKMYFALLDLSLFRHFVAKFNKTKVNNLWQILTR